MIRFFQRPYPSANTVLLLGRRPILVDPGFGADVPELLQWLDAQGVPAQNLSLVVNTHSHCDHAGGNHALQARFGLVIAASAAEALAVNAREPDACRAQWLHQPIEAYTVARPLALGDRLATGDSDWDVLGTPGHTKGHVSLFSAELGVLVLGDALHADDLGWLNPYEEGEDSLERSAETVERLALLPAGSGYSGHGAAITDLPRAIANARRRIKSWWEDPHRVAWHACKRVFAHALMLEDGLAEPAIAPFLLRCPWFRDHARMGFAVKPEAFVPMLVTEMLRAGAAAWLGGKLVASAPYRRVPPDWPSSPACPALWPPT